MKHIVLREIRWFRVTYNSTVGAETTNNTRVKYGQVKTGVV